MTAFIVALALLLAGAMLPRVGERLVDWLIPAGLNFRIGGALARIAIALAASTAVRDEARDALANIEACAAERTGVSPIAVVVPVLCRSASSRVLRTVRPSRVVPPRLTPGPYRHRNSKGVTYYLNAKQVTLRGGKTQTIYYFSKDERKETGVDLPADRTVNENPRNGVLTLKRN